MMSSIACKGNKDEASCITNATGKISKGAVKMETRISRLAYVSKVQGIKNQKNLEIPWTAMPRKH